MISLREHDSLVPSQPPIDAARRKRVDSIAYLIVAKWVSLSYFQDMISIIAISSEIGTPGDPYSAVGNGGGGGGGGGMGILSKKI